MTLIDSVAVHGTGSIPAGTVLPPAVQAALDACANVIVPGSREELYRLALGPEGGPRFTVEYDVRGTPVPEAEVVRCKNGIAVNYPEDYMRRRDPDCMRIATFCSVTRPNRCAPSALRLKLTAGRPLSSREGKAPFRSRPVIAATRWTT